jgi:hypothetical protein
MESGFLERKLVVGIWSGRWIGCWNEQLNIERGIIINSDRESDSNIKKYVISWRCSYVESL